VEPGNGHRDDEATPPDNPEDWTHEQWLAWLAATDEQTATTANPQPPPHRPRSTSARLLYAGMLGLHQAIYGVEPDQPAIVVDADGDPAEPESLEVHLEPDHPEDSSVIVRSWLIERKDGRARDSDS
jgi:hypothetical protein